MFDKRNKLIITSRRARQENILKIKFINTVIPRNVRLSEAPSHGIPILIYDKNFPLAARLICSFSEEVFKTRQVSWKQQHNESNTILKRRLGRGLVIFNG